MVLHVYEEYVAGICGGDGRNDGGDGRNCRGDGKNCPFDGRNCRGDGKYCRFDGGFFCCDVDGGNCFFVMFMEEIGLVLMKEIVALMKEIVVAKLF